MKLYPEIILIASQNEEPVQGFRVCLIGKDFCGDRRGTVPVKVFRAYLKGLGISRATYSRWIKKALELGVMTRIRSGRTGLDYFAFVSYARMAAIAGCKKLSAPVQIELDAFLERSWMSTVLAAYELRFNGKPVSRETLTALTGVSKSTQIYREKRAGVVQKRNVAIWGEYQELAQKNPDFVIGSFDKPGMYISKETGELCQQLPNSREIPPEAVRPAKKGSTNRSNNKLLALLPCGDEAKKQPFVKRYSESPDETKRIKRNLRKFSNFQAPAAIYERWKCWKTQSDEVQGWAACVV